MEMVSLEGASQNETGSTLIGGSSAELPKIMLGEREIQKLALPAMPAFGEKMKLEAVVVVSSISSNDGPNGRSRYLGLEITNIGLGPVESAAEDKSAAMVLYEMGDM